MEVEIFRKANRLGQCSARFYGDVLKTRGAVAN